MESVIALRARRRPRARHLQRLPGPVRGRPAARRAAAQRRAALRLPPGRPRGRRRATRRSRARASRGEPLSIPVKHTTGRYYAPPSDARRARGRRPGRAALRARAATPTARCDDIAGVRNEAGNVFGLMPHPEHAVDPLTGSTDGLKIFESMALTCTRVACLSADALPTVDDARRARPDRATSTTLIVEKLGREPNEVELAMFSLLWSEHCAYKHSKKLLRTLPTEGPRVLHGPGRERRRGRRRRRLAVAFKVESHNHPSAVEPFQGAATGVGGILRDIFAIGARPIAVLDSLRFGEPDVARARATCSTARSAGIGHYGNSIGVPTVGGEVYFEAPYEQNCLVNAMALGLARARRADPQRRGRRRQRRSSCSAPRPAATGSAARRCSPRPSSARTTRTSARRSRSATRSRRRSCSSARWSCSSAGCSSRCRTSARPA